MSKKKREIEKAKQDLARAADYFKGKQVVETVLLINKDAFDQVSDAVEKSQVTALLLEAAFEEGHDKAIQDLGGNIDDFVCLKVIVELKNVKKIVDALSATGLSTHKTDIASAMEQMLTDDSDNKDKILQ